MIKIKKIRIKKYILSINNYFLNHLKVSKFMNHYFVTHLLLFSLKAKAFFYLHFLRFFSLLIYHLIFILFPILLIDFSNLKVKKIILIITKVHFFKYFLKFDYFNLYLFLFFLNFLLNYSIKYFFILIIFLFLIQIFVN